MDFPLRTGSPAGKPLAGVRWGCRVGKISVYPGGPRPPGRCFCRRMDESCWKSSGNQLAGILTENRHLCCESPVLFDKLLLCSGQASESCLIFLRYLFVHTANIIPQSAAVIVLMVSISPVLLYADIAFIVQIAALNPLTTYTNISISEPLSFNPTFNQSSQSVSS